MGVTKRGSGKAALVHSASTVFFLFPVVSSLNSTKAKGANFTL